MDIYNYYEDAMDEVFTSTPSIILERYLGEETRISVIEFLKLSIALEKRWEKYRKYNVQFGIIIDEYSTKDASDKIFEYDFGKDIDKIIKDGKFKSIMYIIDKDGGILNKNSKKDRLSFQKVSIDSEQTKTIAFYLGVNGIDILIRGKIYETKNHLDSYKDLIYPKFYSISEYKMMLQKFFDEQVQYDLRGRYFAQKKNYAKTVHQTLDKHPKLLHAKPEIDFQKDLEMFLLQNCDENVLTEVHNKTNDRYDVWVSTKDDELYVFEIKWLGKSINPEGNIFDKYNKEDRAISGAYQIKDYIDNAEKYSHIFSQEKIYCGILIIFDAREDMNDINYPKEFKNYHQIDLTQHFKMLKTKISASNVYEEMKKAVRKID